MNLKQELKAKRAKLDRLLKENRVVLGAFGNGRFCHGIIEGDIIKPEEGGIFTKYYGCNYLFKGEVNQKSVGGVAFAKRMVSRIAMAASEKPVMIMLAAAAAVFLLFPQKTKRRVVKHLIEIGTELMYEPIRHILLEEKRYCPAAREIRRTILKVFGSLDPIEQ